MRVMCKIRKRKTNFNSFVMQGTNAMRQGIFFSECPLAGLLFYLFIWERRKEMESNGITDDRQTTKQTDR